MTVARLGASELVGVQLARAQVHFQADFDLALDRAFELQRHEYAVMTLFIESPGVSRHETARAIGVTPAAVTQIVRRLQRRGLVEPAQAGTQDRRVRASELTGRGRTLWQAATAELARVEQDRLAMLSRGELQYLKELLGMLATPWRS